MAIEFIGMIHHRQASEIHPPGPMVLDRGYIRDFAQAAEAGGGRQRVPGDGCALRSDWIANPG